SPFPVWPTPQRFLYRPTSSSPLPYATRTGANYLHRPARAYTRSIADLPSTAILNHVPVSPVSRIMRCRFSWTIRHRCARERTLSRSNYAQNRLRDAPFRRTTRGRDKAAEQAQGLPSVRNKERQDQRLIRIPVAIRLVLCKPLPRLRTCQTPRCSLDACSVRTHRGLGESSL